MLCHTRSPIAGGNLLVGCVDDGRLTHTHLFLGYILQLDLVLRSDLNAFSNCWCKLQLLFHSHLSHWNVCTPSTNMFRYRSSSVALAVLTDSFMGQKALNKTALAGDLSTWVSKRIYQNLCSRRNFVILDHLVAVQRR